jgi:hypothetical protein
MARSYVSVSDRDKRRLCMGIVLLLALPMMAGRAASDASTKEQAGVPEQPELLRLLRESRASYHTFATRFVQRKHLARRRSATPSPRGRGNG